MNEKQIEQHVPVLGILHLLGGAGFAVIGVFIFVFLTGIGLATEDAEAVRILTFVGITVGTLLVVLSVPGMVAGYGLLRRRQWARGLAIAVGALNLFNIPIGTIIGVYTLVVLLREEAYGYFVGLQQA